jgi:hypothetical protein
MWPAEASNLAREAQNFAHLFHEYILYMGKNLLDLALEPSKKIYLARHGA